jgi:hypothetical protein
MTDTTWGTRRGLEDDIKMKIQEVGCDCLDWNELTQDRNIY